MEVILKNQADILAVQNELMNILPELKNKPYICEIKPYRKRRSLDANAYFHVLVEEISKVLKISNTEVKKSLNLDYGTISKNENGMCEGFMALKEVAPERFCEYPKPIGQCEINGKTFIKYLSFKRTSELNTAEFSRLLDGTIEEAKQLGIETLTPAEIENLKGYQKEN